MAEHTGLGGLTVRNAAAVVVDGGSKNWVFVRVDTDDGVTGWGECYNFPGREGPVSAMVSQLGRYLRGRSVADIRPFAAYAFRDFGGKRASLELFSAISGIETAMWDALGKATGQPVHRLLGGSFRSGFRVYANGWSMNSCLGRQRIDDVVAAAVGLVEQGFTAMKFDPVPGPWHADLSAELERSTVECVREVRTAVGDSVDLLIELHRRFTLKPALRVVTALEEFRPYWFEEPVRVEDLAALAEIRRATVTPVVSGETLYGKEAFRSLLEGRGGGHHQPRCRSLRRDRRAARYRGHGRGSRRGGGTPQLQLNVGGPSRHAAGQRGLLQLPDHRVLRGRSPPVRGHLG